MPGMTYTTFKLGDGVVAGMMPITPEMGDAAALGNLFHGDGRRRDGAAGGGLGAKICVPLRDIPGVGRFCGIPSPQGVMFYVIKYVR